MKKFPHLVQMHRTHAAEGLVVMSVNPVVPEHKERDKVLKFLKEKGATFPNFLLTDAETNYDKWHEKYPTNVTPTVILFDRAGHRKVLDEPEDGAVEAEVKRMLAAK